MTEDIKKLLKEFDLKGKSEIKVAAMYFLPCILSHVGRILNVCKSAVHYWRDAFLVRRIGRNGNAIASLIR